MAESCGCSRTSTLSWEVSGDPLPKIEVFRGANGKPPLYPEDANIVALISDAVPSGGLPHASIDDIAAAADLVLAHAHSLAEVLAEFGGRS